VRAFYRQRGHHEAFADRILCRASHLQWLRRSLPPRFRAVNWLGRRDARTVLLQILRGSGDSRILKSTRGVEGGYSLSASPQDIFLLEVIEAIDGPLEMAGEPPPADSPDDMQHGCKRPLRQVYRNLRNQLEAIKLRNFCAARLAASAPSAMSAAPAETYQVET